MEPAAQGPDRSDEKERVQGGKAGSRRRRESHKPAQHYAQLVLAILVAGVVGLVAGKLVFSDKDHVASLNARVQTLDAQVQVKGDELAGLHSEAEKLRGALKEAEHKVEQLTAASTTAIEKLWGEKEQLLAEQQRLKAQINDLETRRKSDATAKAAKPAELKRADSMPLRAGGPTASDLEKALPDWTVGSDRFDEHAPFILKPKAQIDGIETTNTSTGAACRVWISAVVVWNRGCTAPATMHLVLYREGSGFEWTGDRATPELKLIIKTRVGDQPQEERVKWSSAKADAKDILLGIKGETCVVSLDAERVHAIASASSIECSFGRCEFTFPEAQRRIFVALDDLLTSASSPEPKGDAKARPKATFAFSSQEIRERFATPSKIATDWDGIDALAAVSLDDWKRIDRNDGTTGWHNGADPWFQYNIEGEAHVTSVSLITGFPGGDQNLKAVLRLGLVMKLVDPTVGKIELKAAADTILRLAEKGGDSQVWTTNGAKWTLLYTKEGMVMFGGEPR